MLRKGGEKGTKIDRQGLTELEFWSSMLFFSVLFSLFLCGRRFDKVYGLQLLHGGCAYAACFYPSAESRKLNEKFLRRAVSSQASVF